MASSIFGALESVVSCPAPNLVDIVLPVSGLTYVPLNVLLSLAGRLHCPLANFDSLDRFEVVFET